MKRLAELLILTTLAGCGKTEPTEIVVAQHVAHMLDSIAAEGVYQLNAVNDVPILFKGGFSSQFAFSRGPCQGYVGPDLQNHPEWRDSVLYGPAGSLSLGRSLPPAQVSSTFSMTMHVVVLCGPVPLGAYEGMTTGNWRILNPRGDSLQLTTTVDTFPVQAAAAGKKNYAVRTSGDTLLLADTLRMSYVLGSVTIPLTFVR